MEEQENEEKDLGQEVVEMGQKKIKQAVKDAERKVQNAAKEKAKELAKKAFFSIIVPNLPYILIFSCIIGGVGIFFSSSSYTVKNEVSKVGKIINESAETLIEVKENGIYAPSKETVMKQIEEQLENIGINKKDLELGNDEQAKEYLYKFLKTSLEVQLPYIENQPNSESALQGIVRIKRRSQDANSVQDLIYTTHEKLEELIENNDISAVNYFALDENLQLCIAKYTTTTITSQTGITSITKTVTNTVSEVKIPYRTMISQYSIPFEFLITLQQISLNAEYVSAVADLVKEQSVIEFTIFDSTDIITTTNIYTYDLNKKWLEVEWNDMLQIEKKDETQTTTKPEINLITKPGTISSRSKVPLEDSGGTKKEEENSMITYVESGSSDPKTEIVTTINEINSVTANVTKANVWVITQNVEYTQNTSTEYPLGESGITTEIADEAEPATPSQVGETVEWKTNQKENVYEVLKKSEWQMNGEANIQIDANKFLGLWRNSTGSYVNGADYVEKPTGQLVKYNIPNSTRVESPVANIINSEELLNQLLENMETTQNHAQLMKYLIHLYKTGEKLTIDLSIYNVNEFTGALYGSSTVKEYIHYFEGTPKQTQDGKYIVFDDGKENLTVGWGIYIKAQANRFAARGIDVSTLKLGSTIDKTIVDSIEDEIIEEYRNYVIETTQGLGLEEYQIDALTSRVYNCGESGGMSGFVQAYTKYGNTQELYDNLLNKPVTSKGEYMPGLEKRRKAEWELFNTGYYVNTGTYYSATSASSSLILQKAKECHDYLRINGYRYKQVGISIPIKNGKTVDCSSYVSWVLYEAGFTEFRGHQKTSSYFAANPMNWEKISKENLQAGDILVYEGHVQIYAGDGKYYNCGSNNSIQTEAPSVYGVSINKSSFLFGLRASR